MTGKKGNSFSDPYSVIIFLTILALPGLTAFHIAGPFAAPQSAMERKLFTVPDNPGKNRIGSRLKEAGIIKSTWAFAIALNETIEPGGYYLTGDMNTWEVADKLSSPPDLIRLTIPEGWRREQTAELLADKLNWSLKEKQNWLLECLESSLKKTEGVYFPDTYLIPRSESPERTRKRLLNRFNQVLKKYNREALEKNIQWTTLVTLASIIEREASGKGDRSLISGILWNRLHADMKLDADASVQYIRDTKKDNGRWWAPLNPGDKGIDSPYNTYRYRGLPPSPISSPGRAALEAALNPEPTTFHYYLHDARGDIHCAITYDQHLANIDRYLKNERS